MQTRQDRGRVPRTPALLAAGATVFWTAALWLNANGPFHRAPRAAPPAAAASPVFDGPSCRRADAVPDLSHLVPHRFPLGDYPGASRRFAVREATGGVLPPALHLIMQ